MLVILLIYFENNANSKIEVGNDKTKNNQTVSVKSDSNVATDKSIADKKAASDLDARITALGDINNLTLDKASDVQTTRKDFEALTSDQKNL
ncbi:hypothetical protein [Clostridium beijerinckii]|uniref:hypothetical protein n=1 Tax=Clostridium beijerinckii TaxID=1520 RepID=UPI000809CF1F|nr:hypothetical protein [Clostridium beijerinckii]OCA97835.1 hypothetical protein BGS1_02065 [Clostridium beijerinckii]